MEFFYVLRSFNSDKGLRMRALGCTRFTLEPKTRFQDKRFKCMPHGDVFRIFEDGRVEPSTFDPSKGITIHFPAIFLISNRISRKSRNATKCWKVDSKTVEKTESKD